MIRRFTILALLGLSLAACGKKSSDQANEVDPAVANALEDQIMVDPNLAAQANRHGARANAAPGQAPLPDTSRGGAPAQGVGKLESAPPAQPGGGRAKITLGQLAEAQTAGKRNAQGSACDQNVQYSMAWATRLPAEFPLYPGAQVTEAGGNDIPTCRMRLVSFFAKAPLQTMIDYYYTQAVRNGFNAEHQLVDGEHILAGTREKDDGAYYLVINPAKGGTMVDMIVNNGR